MTSRAVLHVSGEHDFRVLPLPLPDSALESLAAEVGGTAAVRLFVERATASRDDFTLTDSNAADVVAICHGLDGLPLALELAAARITHLPPAALRTRLDRRLTLLAGGPRDQPARLQSMRDAIAWSFDLLTADEQALFRRLAIFVGGCTLEAAQVVCGKDNGVDVLEGLATLVDMSLLRQEEGVDGEPRFAMLEMIREFGLEQLAESDEAAAIAAHHAAWGMTLAEGVRRSGQLSQGCGLRTLEAELPNLRAALDWWLTSGEVTAAQHLAGLLAEFWLRRGHLSEGEAWLDRALSEDGGPTPARAEALVGRTMMMWPGNEYARAERVLTEAETIAQAVGDDGVLAYVRLHQGYVALYRGDLDLAVARGEEGLVTTAAIPQEFSRNGALWLLARATLERGDDDRASELYERLLQSARAGGDEMSLANAFIGLAVLAERRGELRLALVSYVEAASVCRGFGDRFTLSDCLDGVATAVALRRPEPATRLFAAANTLRVAVGGDRENLRRADLQRHEQALASARVTLGKERFDEAWAAGAALTLDEALAEAAGLAGLPINPGPGNTAARTRNLTAREREVLRLLADGRADKEIAAALCISPRTVGAHVTHLLAKLGVETRTAAAIYAVRHDLS